ncbi:radical SAM protein [Candidatus Parcubacteria bacterium]|nr:radical SAM protein [Candidatus Parcubacteria bacterium]
MIFPLYYLTWNITCRCNLKCRHCYNKVFSEESILDEMSTQEGKDIIEDAIPLGLRAILFTGGEPLVRTDLLELVNFAKKKKLLVFLATNGTLIDSVFIEKFKGLIDKVNISLDAGSAKKHDEIRGSNGAFNKSLEATKKIKKHFNTSIAFTAHAHNLNELFAVAKIAKDIGVFLTIKRYIPVRKESDQSLILSQFNYRKLVNNVNKLKIQQKISFNDPFPASSYKRIDTYSGCLAGVNSLSVDFNGNVYICTKLKLLLGNIKKISLKKIWNNTKILKQLRNRELKGKCGRCDRILSCGGCRAAAYIETGDPLTSDPLCFYNNKKSNKK